MTSTAPYSPPPARRERRGGVIGPLVLIFVGGVFLLENTGYLPANAWLNLWRLWPMVLVLAGIELLLANRIPWPVLAGIAAIVLVIGVVVTTMGTSGAPPGTVARSTTTNQGTATHANVTVRVGAGVLTIGPIVQPGGDQLAVMTYDGPADLAPNPSYSVDGGTGRLDYEISGHPGPAFVPFVGGQSDTPRMDVNLNPGVPISSLTVQTGATDSRLDLANLHVNGIEMSVGAAATWLRLPQAAGTTTAHISGGAATITIEVPQGVAAQIRHRGGLSTINVDQSRFPAAGDGLYRSPDYDAAANKVDLNLETGVTTIQVS